MVRFAVDLSYDKIAEDVEESSTLALSVGFEVDFIDVETKGDLRKILNLDFGKPCRKKFRAFWMKSCDRHGLALPGPKDGGKISEAAI